MRLLLGTGEGLMSWWQSACSDPDCATEFNAEGRTPGVASLEANCPRCGKPGYVSICSAHPPKGPKERFTIPANSLNVGDVIRVTVKSGQAGGSISDCPRPEGETPHK